MSHHAGSHHGRSHHSRPSSPERDRQLRPRQGQRSREHSPQYNKSSSVPHSSAHPSPNHNQAHTLRPRASSPPQNSLRQRNRARRQYPPFPYVEDESTGVSNLGFSPSLENPSKVIDPFDVPNRGTIDQTPLLIEMDLPRAASHSAKAKSEDASRRDSKMDSSFVGDRDRQSPHVKSSNGNGTRPSTPQSMSRSASPVSIFTPSSSDISVNSGIPSSGSGSGSKTSDGDDARSVNFTKGAPGARPAKFYSHSGSVAQENITPLGASRRSSPGLSGSERENVNSSAGRGSHNQAINKAQASSDDLAQPVPRRRPYAQSADLQESRNDLVSAGSRSSHPRSRPASPASTAPSSAKYTPSPPQSPHAASAGLGTYSEMPTTRSARSSPSGSTAGSRPASPTTSRPPSRDQESIRRASTFPLQGYMETRSRPTSLLANSATHIDDVPSPTLPYPLHTSKFNAPYPMDNAIIMPDSENHRYRAVSRDDIDVPRKASNQKNIQPTSREISTSRPEFASRHTANSALPTLQTTAGLISSSQTTSKRSDWAASSPVPTRRGSGKCLEMQGPQDFRDWSVLKSDNRVKICPNCVVKKLHSSPYETHVRTTIQTEADVRVRCCFKDKWQRLAFSVTKYRRSTNLDLLSAMAALDRDITLHPCPGSHLVNQRWVVAHVGRRDTPAFYLCPCDAAKVDKLFPQLEDSFRNSTDQKKRPCKMGSTSARFDNYARKLDKANEEAYRTKSPPDLTDLNELAKLMDQTPECSRDTFVRDGFWHYAPGLSEFTVCAECYVTIVWPASTRGSVAKRISGSERRLDKEHSKGHSCQLHSPRMVSVFHKAVDKDDFEYLAERAKERARKERHIKTQWDDLESRKRAMQRNGHSGAEIAEIEKTLRDLASEWLQFE